jgi:hypothetical protein
MSVFAVTMVILFVIIIIIISITLVIIILMAKPQSNDQVSTENNGVNATSARHLQDVSTTSAQHLQDFKVDPTLEHTDQTNSSMNTVSGVSSTSYISNTPQIQGPYQGPYQGQYQEQYQGPCQGQYQIQPQVQPQVQPSVIPLHTLPNDTTKPSTRAAGVPILQRQAQFTLPKAAVQPESKATQETSENSSTDYSVDSSDDDREDWNSDGEDEDGPFDVFSTASSEEDIYTDADDRNANTSTINYFDRNFESSIIQVISHSNAILFLLDNGNIMKETRNGEIAKISNNIPLLKLVLFNTSDVARPRCVNTSDVARPRCVNTSDVARPRCVGDLLYGLGKDKSLYSLDGHYFSTSMWLWKPVSWANVHAHQITDISVPYDFTHLWISSVKDKNIGYLYDKPDNIVSRTILDNKIRRIYGRDIEHYLDLNIVDHTVVVHPSMVKKTGVYDALLSYHDELVTIDESNIGQWRSLSFVNWQPYYIK